MGDADLREVEHEQWVPFLAEFSQAHFGEPIEVRVVGPGGGAAPLDAGRSPFVSIADRTDGPAGEHIDVVTGPGRPVSHVVSHPIHVRLSSGSRPVVVQVRDGAGATTVVRFLADDPRRPTDA